MRTYISTTIAAMLILAPGVADAQTRYFNRAKLPQAPSAAATGTKTSNGKTVTCGPAPTLGIFYYGGGGQAMDQSYPFQASSAEALKQCENLIRPSVESGVNLTGYSFACDVRDGVAAGDGKYQASVITYAPGQPPTSYDGRGGPYAAIGGSLCTVK